MQTNMQANMQTNLHAYCHIVGYEGLTAPPVGEETPPDRLLHFLLRQTIFVQIWITIHREFQMQMYRPLFPKYPSALL